MYACVCAGIRERQVREAVRSGTTRMSDLCSHLGMGRQCGRCVCAIRAIVQEEQEKQSRNNLLLKWTDGVRVAVQAA